jgi:hypothetical protein
MSITALALDILSQARDEYPEAQSLSDLDDMCDSNEYFLDDKGGYLPELMTDGRFDPLKFFNAQRKVDRLLRIKPIK